MLLILNIKCGPASREFEPFNRTNERRKEGGKSARKKERKKESMLDAA